MLNIILIIVKFLQYIIPGAFIIVKNKFNRYLFCTKIKWVWTVYAIFINRFMKRKLFQPILFLQKLGSYSIHIFAINCRLKRFFDLKNAINCTQFVHKVKQIDTVLTVVLEWQRHHSLYDRNFFFSHGFVKASHSDVKKVTCRNFIQYDVMINLDGTICIPFEKSQGMYRHVKSELDWNCHKNCFFSFKRSCRLC